MRVDGTLIAPGEKPKHGINGPPNAKAHSQEHAKAQRRGSHDSEKQRLFIFFLYRHNGAYPVHPALIGKQKRLVLTITKTR